MANIATQDARPLFTKDLVAVYRQMTDPTMFMSSFFKETFSTTKLISIEAQRGFEYIAYDVIRGTEGFRNKFPRSTEKVIEPPMYEEYFDMTELDLYDRLFGSTDITGSDWADFVYSAAMKTKELQNKINRAYELQCAQVLQTGIVTLKNGDNINYQRKSASMVDPGAGNYWANSTGGAANPSGIDPYKQLEEGCEFLRKTGKVTDGIFNLVLGKQAISDLFTNAFFLQRQNLFSMALDTVHAPQRMAQGATLHGVLSVGNYKVIIWGYEQYYTDPTTKTQYSYLDENTAVMTALNPEFTMSFAAVPQLLTDVNGARVAPKQGKFIVNEFLDQRKAKHDIDIKSAGIAVPVAVDKIWTLKTGV